MAKKSRRKNKKRKSGTRKKRGGWRRIDTNFNKDDIGYYYDCWNRDGNYDDVKYREGMTITGKWDVLRPISEWKILEMRDSHRYDPNLYLKDESRPVQIERPFGLPAQRLCSKGFKPLKRNDAKTGAGRKKKTRRKRGGNLPLEFQGKAELLQLIINEIQGLGGIFQTKEYNIVQNDYESTNIYIKKQDVENLPPDANGIPVYMVDNNNNPTNYRHTLPIAVLTLGYILIRKKDGDWFKSKDSQYQLSGGRRKKKTRKKRGAVKFGKNKTTAEIVKEGQKILQTTQQKERIKRREQQIKLTGDQEFSSFKKQAMNKMKIAFYKSFKKLPNDTDRKILSLVYKSLKQPLNKQEEKIIQDYHAENNENKRKLVWMNNSSRQLRVMSEKTKHQIYNTGDDPEVIKKYRPRKKQIKMGPASGLVIDTNKYMSPVKGPDTRYPRLSLDIGERGKSHKNLFKGGRKKKRRTRKKNRR